MGKVDTSDLIMMIRWIINILSITLTWMGQFNTYTPTYCKENKEGKLHLKHTLDKLFPASIYARLWDISTYVFNANEQICMMTTMRGYSMHKAELDLKAIIYAAYDAT